MQTQRTGGGWRGHAATAVLGVLFLTSAIAKLAGLGAFERYLVEQGLAGSLGLAELLARLLIALELFIGLAFFQRAWVHRVLVPATACLLAAFSVYLGYLGWIKGDDGSCHCLGELVAMSPLASLAKNVVMLGVCWLAFVWTREWQSRRWWIPAAMGGVSIAVVFGAFPMGDPPARPGEPSRFAQFNRFLDGQREIAPDLTRGECVVAFFSLDCDHCKAVASQLADARDRLPPVYMVCLGDPAIALDFQFETGAEFPWQLVEPELFFQFIGPQPPRVYLLNDGQPIGHWDTDFSIEALLKRR